MSGVSESRVDEPFEAHIAPLRDSLGELLDANDHMRDEWGFLPAADSLAMAELAAMSYIAVVVSTVAMFLVSGSPDASAACPTTNSSYTGVRVGGLTNTGSYALRWRVSGITDAPCSKVNLTDSSSPGSNCIELDYDWNMSTGTHYDGRLWISCHQANAKERTLSEANRGEHNAGQPTDYHNIDAMRWARACTKVGGQSGSRTGCVTEVNGQPPANVMLNPPDPCNDFFIWNSVGNPLVQYNTDSSQC